MSGEGGGPAEQVAQVEKWLHSYPDDVAKVRDAVFVDDMPAKAQRVLIGGLNYQLKEVDLVPDWEGGIGVADDVMILRIACARALEEELPVDVAAALTPLAHGADVAKALLGGLYDRVVAFVDALPTTKVQGRDAAAIVDDEGQRRDFLREIDRDVARHKVEPIGDAEKFQRELRHYVRDRLPK